jgi:nitrate/nitrite-specific signal transduction histidine kinase
MSEKDLENQLEDLFSDIEVPYLDTDATRERVVVEATQPAKELAEQALIVPVEEGERLEEEPPPLVPEEAPVREQRPVDQKLVKKGRRRWMRLSFRPRWSIAFKLTSASVLMIFFVVLAAGVGLWQVLVIGQAMTAVQKAEEQRAQALEMQAAGHRLVAAFDHLLRLKDATLTTKELLPAHSLLSFHLYLLQRSDTENRMSGPLGELQLANEDLQQVVDKVDLQSRQNQWGEVSFAMESKVRPINQRIGTFIEQVVLRVNRNVERATLLADQAVRRATFLLVILAALTTGIAFSWRQIVFRQLGQSIASLRHGVARISGGELGHVLDIHTGDEIEELAVEFNGMAAQLANMIDTLEHRVAERTHELNRRAVQLQAAAQVSHAASSVLGPEALIQQTVNLIHDRFDYYYVGLFLLDASRRWAVLQAGTGQAGRAMLTRGHKLEVGGDSMVGWCTARGRARIALDVGDEAVRFDNPLLPETRSEMALPLVSRGQVIGALTVQSTAPRAFSEGDIAVLQTMVDQVANAIENARLLQEMEHLVRRNQIISEISTKLRGALDLDAVLQTTVREMGSALGASEAVIRLGFAAPSARSDGDGTGGQKEVQA